MKFEQLKGAVLIALVALVSSGANARPTAAGCYTVNWFDANGAIVRTQVLTLGSNGLAYNGTEPSVMGSWQQFHGAVQIQEIQEIDTPREYSEDIRSYWLELTNPDSRMSGKLIYKYEHTNRDPYVQTKIYEVYDAQGSYTPDDPYCVR
ncbi:MAG: hypothetical protein LCH73_02015 [Proteobacteria bacterium]|nr:hypothetical protein [Pseudomonadota bacterium]